MSKISTIDRIVAEIPIRDGWYFFNMLAKSPSFSIVDKIRRFELASIWSEVPLPTLVSLENMSVIICDIFGNLFRVKFLAICKKKGRILTLDLRFSLCTSSLSGNKHFAFLKKRHVLSNDMIPPGRHRCNCADPKARVWSGRSAWSTKEFFLKYPQLIILHNAL